MKTEIEYPEDKADFIRNMKDFRLNEAALEAQKELLSHGHDSYMPMVFQVCFSQSCYPKRDL